MSYSILYGLNRATQSLEEIATYRNAAGFAQRIWDPLVNQLILPRYPHKHGGCTSLWSDEELERLWRLAQDPDVPEFARACLASTFDYATVSAANRLRLSDHLREFSEKLQPESSRFVNNLPQMSRDLAGAVGDYELFCWYGHSVSEDLWNDVDSESEEPVPYDFSTGTKHFEIYDYIQPEVAG